MAGENGQSRKLILVKFAVLALLLLTSGFTLTACKITRIGGKSIGQPKENQPAKSDQKQSDEQLKKNQPAKSDQKQSDQKNNSEQDTQVDDDPE
jgi:hypothetical protein